MKFEKGEIIEEGTIQELLNSNSKFKKLYELQTGVEIA
jgi:ABC-type multidrug transport system fused ATPase/permease subunit